MRRFASILIITATLSPGCTSQEVRHVSDAVLASRIVGTWTEDEKIGKDMTRFEKTYYADGAASAEFLVREPGAERFRQVGSSSSKWKVENGILITYDHYTVPADVISREKVFRDRVISVDEKEFVIFDTEENAKRRAVRHHD